MCAPTRASLHKHSRSRPKQRKHAEMAAPEAEKTTCNTSYLSKHTVPNISDFYASGHRTFCKLCQHNVLWKCVDMCQGRLVVQSLYNKYYTVHTLFCLFEGLISASLLASTNL